MSRTKGREFNTELDLARDQNGRPIRAIITAGTTADWSQAEDLRPGIQAQYLLAGGGYDSQAILQKANRAEMRLVILTKKREKTREIATKIDTKCGRKSKMLSGILNGGVE